MVSGVRVTEEYSATAKTYLELVADVKFVGVKEKQNEVGLLCEPLHDPDKVVASANALLVTREDTGCIDERKVLQNGRRALRALELVQKRSSELCEPTEWLVPRHCYCVSWRAPLL